MTTQARDSAVNYETAAETFPLTPIQQAYWIGRQDGQILGATGCQAYLELDGRNVEPTRLDTAVRALIARHGMLRMRLVDVGFQTVCPKSVWPGLTVHDLRDRSSQDAQAELTATRNLLANTSLQPEVGHVLDVHLSLCADGFTRTHMVFDLVAVDGQSLQILLGDLGDLYLDPAGQSPISDYGLREYLLDTAGGTQKEALARDYWSRQIDQLPGQPTLPLRRKPEAISRPEIRRVEYKVPMNKWMKLTENARVHGVTPAMALATAYAETVGFWASDPQFLMNIPIFHREQTHPNVPKLVGDFSNLVLVPIDLSASQSFAQRAQQVQCSFLTSLEKSAMSGVEVLRELTRRRPGAGSHAPLVFTYNIRNGDFVSKNCQQQIGKLTYTSGRTPQVWIDHQVHLVGDEVWLIWEAVDELFPDGLVDDMGGAYAGLVAGLADAATWAVPAQFHLPHGQSATRATVNHTAAPEPCEPLHQRFFSYALRTPDRIALRWAENGQMTYGELAENASKIAGALQRVDIQREEPVGIALPRSPEQIAAVLGVLEAGAAYVPLVEQPLARRERIIARAGIRHVITDGSNDLPSDVNHISCAEILSSIPTAPTPLPTPSRLVSPDDLAYVLFTSGSTGEPKGAELTHRAAVNTIADINSRFGVGEEDRILAVSSLNFDLSVYDIFGLLSAGGSIVLLPDAERNNPDVWLDLVVAHKPTIWNSVPAIMDMFLTILGPDQTVSNLRVALLSGDWVGLDLPGRLEHSTQGRCRFIALGGATEAAVWSNLTEVAEQLPSDWPSIPYGSPLTNQRHRIVDHLGRDRPDWAAGELWIGGTGVARGYRGDPHLTADRFVEHADLRWYRTGDLARYRPAGLVEFLGRTDHQVELQGNRIELGEVETALRDCPGVSQAVCLPTGDGLARRLVAFVIARGSTSIELGMVRQHIAGILPKHMHPANYYVIDTLPLTRNGKVDRAVLSEWISTDDDIPCSEPPRAGWEQILAAEWRVLLPAAPSSRRDSFYALGGNSVLATQLASVLRRKYGIPVKIRDLFSSTTLADMASSIEACSDHGAPRESETGGTR